MTCKHADCNPCHSVTLLMCNQTRPPPPPAFEHGRLADKAPSVIRPLPGELRSGFRGQSSPRLGGVDWLSSLGIIAQIWGPAKGQLAPRSHRLLTHTLAGHVHPASPPPLLLLVRQSPHSFPVVTSLPHFLDHRQEMSTAGDPVGGKCGRTRTHLCPPTQQPVSPSLPPRPSPSLCC